MKESVRYKRARRHGTQALGAGFSRGWWLWCEDGVQGREACAGVGACVLGWGRGGGGGTHSP
jgi:hypothetical protein